MFNLPKLASAHQASGSTESEEVKDILVPSTLFSKWQTSEYMFPYFW